jgi:hypothetical protein
MDGTRGQLHEMRIGVIVTVRNADLTSSSKHPRRLATLVVVIVALAALLVGGAFAAGLRLDTGHVRRVPPGGMFSHAPKPRAHAASVSEVNAPPAGAVLAATAKGKEVYTWQTASPVTSAGKTLSGAKICVMERQTATGLASVGCYVSAEIEAKGTVSVNLPSKIQPTLGATALVPNNVPSITATDKNGTTTPVAVKDNVAVLDDEQLAAVSYRLPNGTTQVTNVLEVVAHSEGSEGPPPGPGCQPSPACKVTSSGTRAPVLE